MRHTGCLENERCGTRHSGCFETRAGVGELCYTRDGGDGNLARQDYPMSFVSCEFGKDGLLSTYMLLLLRKPELSLLYIFLSPRSWPLKAAYRWWREPIPFLGDSWWVCRFLTWSEGSIQKNSRRGCCCFAQVLLVELIEDEDLKL
jgi:hypothetical protein